jgi:putative YphP/YqiW family bacilliredoxin
MRPAVRIALENATKPENVGTVFAGQDRDATEQARRYFEGYPPSSPSIALLQDGKVVHMMQRSDIEHRDAHDIAAELTRSFNKYCGNVVSQ